MQVNEKRDSWGNRSAFIFAAVASAVGIGNAWRFAGQVYQNGGGAFLIPYIIAIITFGIPILILEISIGKKYQLGAPSAMAQMRKSFEWIGWAGVLTCFVISSYYSTIIAWIVAYIFYSFTMPWGGDPAAFFQEEVLKLSASPGELGGFSWIVVIGLVLTWLLVIFALRRGVKSLGKISKWTVLVPIVILAIMCIQGLSMPGALDGIKYYITPKWEVLVDPNTAGQIWGAAFGQVCYSMSILFAIMISYGSYLSKKTNVVKDAVIIGGADLGISLFAGFVVFATLGFLSFQTKTPIDQMSYQGVMLAFVTYPQALANFPGGAVVGSIFSVLFFLMLFGLAIGSLFSIVETIATSVMDKFKLTHKKAVTLVGSVCFVMSMLFATNAGLYWLDIVDHFTNEFNLLMIGVLETIAVAWIFGIGKMRSIVNEGAVKPIGKWWSAIVKYLCPAVCIILSGSFLYTNLTKAYGGYEQQYLIAGGWAVIIATFVLAIILSKVKGKKTEESKVAE